MNNKIVIVEDTQEQDRFNDQNSSKHHLQLPEKNGFDGISKESGLIIDKAAYIVFLNGNKITFPKKEFELLLLLASNPRKVFKRDEILRNIWGREFKAKDSRSLDVHIRMLRKKLDNNFITTLRGVGYKLEKN